MGSDLARRFRPAGAPAPPSALAHNQQRWHARTSPGHQTVCRAPSSVAKDHCQTATPQHTAQALLYTLVRPFCKPLTAHAGIDSASVAAEHAILCSAKPA